MYLVQFTSKERSGFQQCHALSWNQYVSLIHTEGMTDKDNTLEVKHSGVSLALSRPAIHSIIHPENVHFVTNQQKQKTLMLTQKITTKTQFSMHHITELGTCIILVAIWKLVSLVCSE
jgi:hypothetical protein